jgi:hypothetical protein
VSLNVSEFEIIPEASKVLSHFKVKMSDFHKISKVKQYN